MASFVSSGMCNLHSVNYRIILCVQECLVVKDGPGLPVCLAIPEHLVVLVQLAQLVVKADLVQLVHLAFLVLLALWERRVLQVIQVLMGCQEGKVTWV